MQKKFPFFVSLAFLTFSSNFLQAQGPISIEHEGYQSKIHFLLNKKPQWDQGDVKILEFLRKLPWVKRVQDLGSGRYFFKFKINPYNFAFSASLQSGSEIIFNKIIPYASEKSLGLTALMPLRISMKNLEQESLASNDLRQTDFKEKTTQHLLEIILDWNMSFYEATQRQIWNSLKQRQFAESMQTIHSYLGQL